MPFSTATTAKPIPQRVALRLAASWTDPVDSLQHSPSLACAVQLCLEKKQDSDLGIYPHSYGQQGLADKNMCVWHVINGTR